MLGNFWTSEVACLGPRTASSEGMKTFLVLILSVTALYLWQRSGDREAVTENKPAVEKVAAVAATPRPVYEHDWAKHSLDRAQEVANQVRTTRQQNEQP